MELVSTKVPADILGDVEALQEQEGITQSEAVRRLMRKGIKKEQEEQTDHSLSTGILIYSAVFLAVGLVGTTGGVTVAVDASFGPPMLALGLIGTAAGIYVRREREGPDSPCPDPDQE
jgi:hypothetical protein